MFYLNVMSLTPLTHRALRLLYVMFSLVQIRLSKAVMQVCKHRIVNKHVPFIKSAGRDSSSTVTVRLWRSLKFSVVQNLVSHSQIWTFSSVFLVLEIILKSNAPQREKRKEGCRCDGSWIIHLLYLLSHCNHPSSSYSVFSDHSKRPDRPSLLESLRPVSVRRSSTSWTPTCSGRTPRVLRASRPTGKTSTSRRRTAPPAYQTPCSATTTPSLTWDCPAPPARYRAIPMTTAAGVNMGTRWVHEMYCQLTMAWHP